MLNFCIGYGCEKFAREGKKTCQEHDSMEPKGYDRSHFAMASQRARRCIARKAAQSMLVPVECMDCHKRDFVDSQRMSHHCKPRCMNCGSTFLSMRQLTTSEMKRYRTWDGVVARGDAADPAADVAREMEIDE